LLCCFTIPDTLPTHFSSIWYRKKLCLYDQQMHSENPVVHFRADEIDGTRLITQFYSFLWFEDWKHDVWTKRFVRDRLRYKDEILCFAARVIKAMRSYVRLRDPVNIVGDYDAVHIRRNDFQVQFPDTQMNASQIVLEIQEFVNPGNVLFIATDEHDRSFFQPVEEVYDVKYVGDFASEMAEINPNFFGLVEQLVASRSRVFVGTFYSTFSSYVGRLRGYYSVKEKQDGYTTGGLLNTYYLPGKFKREMRLYKAIQMPFYARDYPTAWRDIDRLELPMPAQQIPRDQGRQ